MPHSNKFTLAVFAAFSLIGLCTPALAQITQDDYEAIREKVHNVYEPRIQAQGFNLVSYDHWSSTDLAYAQVTRNYLQMEVTVSGDYATFPHQTKDGFLLVMCHEYGHLFGGAPWNPSAELSYETQAEYYSTLRCFKDVVKSEDNLAWVKQNHPRVAKVMRKKCAAVYVEKESQAMCIRGMRAAQDAIHARYPKAKISLKKSNTDEDIWINDFYEHRSPQCRLDTLVAGLLCPASGDTDPFDFTKGTCTDPKIHPYGIRPKCGFSAEDMPRLNEVIQEYLQSQKTN